MYRRRNLEVLVTWLTPLGWPIVYGDTVGEFNRSAARNAGVELARTSVVIVMDADMRIDHLALRAAVSAADQHGGLHHPYRFVHYLDEGDTRLVLHGVQPLRPYYESDNAPGGCSVIRRSDYLAIGGFDETFQGWGFEDNDFATRASAAFGQTWGQGVAYHLWHPPAERTAHSEANRMRVH